MCPRWKKLNKTPLDNLVSSPEEFHPEALADPYVTVSRHTAPIIQPEKVQQVSSAGIGQDDVSPPSRATLSHA